MYRTLTGSRRMDALLPVAVAALILGYLHAPLASFVCAGVGLVPLAAVLGRATRRLAQRQGPLVAGLLQATFGNASELILALAALHAGLLTVVKASLTGSIVSNLLLVLGLALTLGGVRQGRLRFNREVAASQATSLFLAVIGLAIPAVFAAVAPAPALSSRLFHFSLWTAAILILVYVASLRYQLDRARPAPATASPVPLRASLIALAVATVGIALLSQQLMAELQAAQHAFHGTDLFWGGVVFAIIGNAAEQGVAIGAARRGEVDLALAISLGSSQQIALLVAPAMVFFSIALHHPMTLAFSWVEIVAIAAAVLMVALIASDGESNWLEGVQLLAVYALLAAAFYFV